VEYLSAGLPRSISAIMRDYDGLIARDIHRQRLALDGELSTSKYDCPGYL
jgi:hypothetical protein